jgi:hypothetical protein
VRTVACDELDARLVDRAGELGVVGSTRQTGRDLARDAGRIGGGHPALDEVATDVRHDRAVGPHGEDVRRPERVVDVRDHERRGIHAIGADLDERAVDRAAGSRDMGWRPAPVAAAGDDRDDQNHAHASIVAHAIAGRTPRSSLRFARNDELDRGVGVKSATSAEAGHRH